MAKVEQNIIRANLRTPEGISILNAAVTGSKLSTSLLESSAGGAASLVWSSKGEFCAALSSGSVTISNSKTQKQEAKLDVPGLHAIAFSPKSTYLITFQRPSKDAGNADKNLKLWDWRSGEIKLQLYQKSFSKDSWPQLQLTVGEELVLHMVGGSVNAYDPQDASKGVLRKLNLKGVGGFAVNADPKSPVLAAFVPEGKGIPGFIGLWRLLELQKSPNSPQPYSRRSFFRATSARLFWNAKGTSVLALTASETDASNKSYYGEQKLHFLAANGTNDCLVPLPKEGPVHDVQWSPSGDHFVTVSGYMPAKTSLFSSKCRLVHDLGPGPYNMVRWNPQGRFLAVGGFGNLPGDIGFHEKKENDTCKPLGAAKAEDAVTMEWSPDGRHLLTATTAPRMRVNNGIQIFRYSGELLEEKKLEVLYEASWQPTDAAAFEDRPASPPKGGAAAHKATAAPIRAAGYVPPHVRSSGGATSSSSGGHFSLAREQSPADKLSMGPKTRCAVPGADPDSAAVSKKKRQRSRKKGGGPAGEERGEEGDAAECDAGAGAVEVPPAAGVEQLSLESGSNEAASDPGKRIRNLRKKLTQIQQLRDKVGSGAVEKLEPEQQAKLDSEAGILAELKSLEGKS